MPKYTDPMMDEATTPQGMVEADKQPPAEAETPAPEMEETPTFTVGAEQFGDRKPKAGEKLLFEVLKTDPETGDAQMRFAGDKTEGEEPEDSMAALDRKLPAEQDEESGSY